MEPWVDLKPSGAYRVESGAELRDESSKPPDQHCMGERPTAKAGAQKTLIAMVSGWFQGFGLAGVRHWGSRDFKKNKGHPAARVALVWYRSGAENRT